MRRTLTVLAGIASASLTMFAIQALSNRIFPAPAGMDFNNQEALKAFIATLPIQALFLVLASYALGSFVGGSVSTIVNRTNEMRPALIVGGLLTVFGAINLWSIPHPIWFAVASTAIYAPFAWLGNQVVRKIKS